MWWPLLTSVRAIPGEQRNKSRIVVGVWYVDWKKAVNKCSQGERELQPGN